MMFHFVSLDIFFCPSLCQKIHDLRKSNLVHTPLGISRKDSINMSKLVRTELISTRWSPYDNNLIQLPSIFLKMIFHWFLHTIFQLHMMNWDTHISKWEGPNITAEQLPILVLEFFCTTKTESFAMVKIIFLS
jgi:hypothetical protein